MNQAQAAIRDHYRRLYKDYLKACKSAPMGWADSSLILLLSDIAIDAGISADQLRDWRQDVDMNM